MVGVTTLWRVAVWSTYPMIWHTAICFQAAETHVDNPEICLGACQEASRLGARPCREPIWISEAATQADPRVSGEELVGPQGASNMICSDPEISRDSHFADSMLKRVLEYGAQGPVFHGNLREQTGERGFPRKPTGNLFSS